MKMLRELVAACALAALAIVAAAAPAAAQAPLTAGSGPYPSVMEVDPGLPDHTVYRPQDLKPAGRLPIVVFGNGGCIAMGNMNAPLLGEVASHGYLAIAIGAPHDPALLKMLAANAGAKIAVGPKAVTAPPRTLPPAPPGLTLSKPAALTEAIDWAIAENSRRGSRYYHRLATDKIAVMGQSCGGMQAMAVSVDPRVTTTVMLNSALFAPGVGPTEIADSSILSRLHAPVLYLIGGPSDMAYRPAVANFPTLSVPAFMGNIDVGHSGALGEPNGGRFGQATVTWLDWRLKGDAKASQMFAGPDCGLCAAPGWTVQRRNMD